MKNIIRSHKNTVVGVLSIFFFVYCTYLLLTKEITFVEYGAYLGSVGGMVATIVSLIAPDGNFSKKKKVDEKDSDTAN